MASSSVEVKAALTLATQSAGRSIGQGLRVGEESVGSALVWWAGLPHLQASARATRPAWRALRST
jgi:hypothetical protein